MQITSETARQRRERSQTKVSNTRYILNYDSKLPGGIRIIFPEIAELVNDLDFLEENL